MTDGKQVCSQEESMEIIRSGEKVQPAPQERDRQETRGKREKTANSRQFLKAVATGGNILGLLLSRP